jgi:hypothetical protein
VVTQLIVEVEESLSLVDVDEIIVSKNITDEYILKILHTIAQFKNTKMDLSASKIQLTKKI